MKVKLESTELQNRGLELESETDEEKTILLDIWTRQGRPVVLTRLPSPFISPLGFKIEGNVRLSIAPVAEDKQ